MDYTWRAFNHSDLAQLRALEVACRAEDGLLAVPKAAYDDALRLAGYITVCAVSPQGKIDAAGTATLQGATAMLFGQVHPDQRLAGLGTELLANLEEDAHHLGDVREYVIRNEALTNAAEQLYAKASYQTDFIEDWLRRDLGPSAPPLPPAPPDIAIARWTADTAHEFYTAHGAAFSTRGYIAPPAEQWIAAWEEEDDFEPEMCFLVRVEGQPAAFVLSYLHGLHPEHGFIGSVGTVPDFRRRGLSRALLVHTLHRMAEAGCLGADIHVNQNNPEAAALYLSLGFAEIGQRGKYSKPATLNNEAHGL